MERSLAVWACLKLCPKIKTRFGKNEAPNQLVAGCIQCSSCYILKLCRSWTRRASILLLTLNATPHLPADLESETLCKGLGLRQIWKILSVELGMENYKIVMMVPGRPAWESTPGIKLKPLRSLISSTLH